MPIGAEPRRCPRCAAPMAVLALPTRSEQTVEVDHCARCHLVWFDPLESVMLAGLGWVRLLRQLQFSAPEPSTRASPPWACPVCAQPLREVHNRTRFGRFAALECPSRHGHLHSQLGLLAERGLVRAPLPADRQALQRSGRATHCLNCGAAQVPGRAECAHCGSPAVVVDLARLAEALAVTSQAQDRASQGPGMVLAWPCSGCGSPLDPTSQASCSSCGSAVVATDWPQLTPLLDAAEDALTPPPPRPYRPKPQRPARSWRDTQLQGLRDVWRDEQQQGLAAAGIAAVVIVLVLLGWLLR